MKDKTKNFPGSLAGTSLSGRTPSTQQANSLDQASELSGSHQTVWSPQTLLQQLMPEL